MATEKPIPLDQKIANRVTEKLPLSGLTGQISAMNALLSSMLEQNRALVESLPVLGIQRGETLVVSGQDTVAALTGNISTRSSPWDAICTTVAIYYPAGCNGAVDVAVGHGDKKFCPEEGYIALNNTTLVLPVYEAFAMDEQLWFEVMNGDPVNAHTISVVVVLQRRSPWHSQ